MDALFNRSLPIFVDKHFIVLKLLPCIHRLKLYRSFKRIHLLVNSYLVCSLLSPLHISVQMLSRFCLLTNYPCFSSFSLSVLVYVFPSRISFYCLPTYLILLVSIYIIAVLSDVCKPPGLLLFVNFINVLFTSFSTSLIEILNKSQLKTYSYSNQAQYITSHHYLMLAVIQHPFPPRS